MKNSLIPKKNVVEGKEYWCIYNNFSLLHLMRYAGYQTFEGTGISMPSQEVRVMFEGYVNTNKSRIPKDYLVAKRFYWCRYANEEELSLMRYEENSSFYSKAHDVFWSSKDIKVIFEDYEH